MARYNQDGSLDSSFGGDGTVRTTFPPANAPKATDAIVQPDGKIVAAGYVEDAEDKSDMADGALVRYKSDGSLDQNFGNGGKVIAKLEDPGWSSGFESIALEPDGKVLAAGCGQSEEENDFALARYRPDGSLDSSFGRKGVIVTDFGTSLVPSSDIAYGMALERNGDVVLAGSANRLWGPRSGERFAVARYLGRRPSCVVPAVVGLSIGRGRRLISRTYCALAPIHWISHSRIGKRRVISQRPRAGTRHPAGTRIYLTVSRGRN